MTSHHHHHHHQNILPKGKSFTTNSGTKVTALPKCRSSAANSGIKVALLLWIDRCGSFPLLLFSIWINLKRSQGNQRGDGTGNLVIIWWWITILLSETRIDLTRECVEVHSHVKSVLLSVSNIVIHHQNYHEFTSFTKLLKFTLMPSESSAQGQVLHCKRRNQGSNSTQRQIFYCKFRNLGCSFTRDE